LPQIRPTPKRHPVLDNPELRQSAHPPSWANPETNGVYDLVVIGGGPAGLRAATGAARLGKRVALIERNLLGGNSLIAGSVPSKSLIRTSRWYGEIGDGENVTGVAPPAPKPDFAAAMERMRHIRARLAGYCSAPRLRDAGIDVLFGNARFCGPNIVTAGASQISFNKALIATGAHPAVPSIPGLEGAGYFTSDTIFEVTECPNRLSIVGGGPLGCELAQTFQRLGAHVTLVQNEPKFLPLEERDAAQLLSESLARSGVEIRLNTTVTAVRPGRDGKLVEIVSNENTSTVVADDILVGVGRLPNIDGLALDIAGVDHDRTLGVHVNGFMQTSNANIFAAGDVCMREKFTHAAEASADVALHNAFNPLKQRNLPTIPRCTYTDPEIAHVGLQVWEAREQSIPVSTITVLMHDVARAVVDGEENGFVKIHIRDGTDRILGSTIVGRHAGDIIATIVLAMDTGVGLRTLASSVDPYPTRAGAIKMAAEAFERSQKSTH
jgi:pyruvate/2-oxoglutarate dehydrogenase complex dihydrolipoamide dehydrogenase (E3) component